MSATLQQTQSDTKVHAAQTSFVAPSSEEDITISPRMVRTSGNDQGSHPADNKCHSSTQEEKRDATDSERAYEASME